MTNALQAAAAAPGIDPNTLIANTPDTGSTPGKDDKPSTIAGEKEQFTDIWAQSPDGMPPTRTWLDASRRTDANGQYLSAFYDTPQPQPETPASPADNAAAINAMTAPPPAAPAAPAANPNAAKTLDFTNDYVSTYRDGDTGALWGVNQGGTHTMLAAAGTVPSDEIKSHIHTNG